MNLQLRFIIIFLLPCQFFNSCADVNQTTNVPILNVENYNLYPVLDSIMDVEKRCDYYNSEMIFNIFQNNITESDSNIKIEAIGYKIDPTSGLLGGFFYRNHLVLVEGLKLDSTLFSIKKGNYNLNVLIKRDNDILYDYEIESYSMWIYKYSNYMLYFEERISNCNDD